MTTPTTRPDTARAFAPTTARVLRVNLDRERARALCRDLDLWRYQTGKALRFSGVICGDYARLYVSTDGTGRFPTSLIALACKHIKDHHGTAAIVGAWLLELEYGQIVGEQQLLEEVASC